MAEARGYPAYLVIRSIEDRAEVKRIGVSSLSERHVERVMRGLLINMDTGRFFIDESEVDKAREESGEG
jgi:hypothetical protein